MGWAAAASMALQAVGTMQAADAQKQAGAAQRTSANATAAIDEQQAGQTRATYQRAALEKRHQATLVASRAQAVGAASGADASDTSVTHIIADIKGRGEYNALADLYTGEERARGLETDASFKRFEGDTAASAGKQKANATLLSGFGTILGSSSANTLYSKYGSPSPSSAPAGFNSPYMTSTRLNSDDYGLMR